MKTYFDHPKNVFRSSGKQTKQLRKNDNTLEKYDFVFKNGCFDKLIAYTHTILNHVS